jgi:acyl CoA:acetate/3-ketoacid CoA transferase alpha subunit
MARCKSPWKFIGSTGHLNSLLTTYLDQVNIWLEIIHIGTLRARYRAGHYNVANATVSTIYGDGEAHVAYEEGGGEDLAKEAL